MLTKREAYGNTFSEAILSSGAGEKVLGRLPAQASSALTTLPATGEPLREFAAAAVVGDAALIDKLVTGVVVESSRRDRARGHERRELVSCEPSHQPVPQ